MPSNKDPTQPKINKFILKKFFLKGPGKIGIGEGVLNLAGGNITGVYERMISEKWCKAEPDYRCRRGVWREIGRAHV